MENVTNNDPASQAWEAFKNNENKKITDFAAFVLASRMLKCSWAGYPVAEGQPMPDLVPTFEQLKNNNYEQALIEFARILRNWDDQFRDWYEGDDPILPIIDMSVMMVRHTTILTENITLEMGHRRNFQIVFWEDDLENPSKERRDRNADLNRLMGGDLFSAKEYIEIVEETTI